MQRFTNEIYSIIKPLQYIRINDFYASHLFYFRTKKNLHIPQLQCVSIYAKTNASNANNHCNPLFTPRYTIYVCHDWMIESQYPYGFVYNFKPMDWLQRHCGWCHMVDWCNTRDSHGKTMISPPGNLAFSCVLDFQYQMGEWPGQVFWD